MRTKAKKEVRKPTSFGRFYASFNLLPWEGDRDEFKDTLVLQYTEGRTSSLREMTAEEYNSCCDALEKMSGRRDQLKKERSQCLHQMQKLGIKTEDWAQVNSFCENPKIAGKAFARLSIDELQALSVKMRALASKGWKRGDTTSKIPTPDGGTAEPEAVEPLSTASHPVYMMMSNPKQTRPS